ncbi:MAG TPA: methyl-accepting chemotaxis protein [Clostridium sp.]|jgi:methyl-accepting chemotaxis protein|nr:methyl-accepting chemotaxis protein [Clostridium sp.]
MKLDLSKRIIIFVGILVLLVSLSIGLISIKVSSNAIIKEVEEAMIRYADEGAKHMETRISVSLTALYEVANRDRTRSMDLQIQKESMVEDVERLGYLDLAVVMPDGTAHYVLGEETANLGDREYVKRAFQGEPNVSNPIISRVTNSVVVMFAAPIEVDGNVEAVLIGRRDGTTLNDITDEMGLGDKGFAFVLGPDGTFYSHPNREFVMEQRNIFKDIEEEGSLKSLGEAINRLGMGNTGLANHEFLEEEYITAIAKIPNSNWTLGIAADKKEVLHSVTSLRNIILLVFAIVFILGMLASIALSRTISNPIKYLVDIIKKMSEYDLTFDKNHKAMKSINRTDEIGIITRSVVKMQSNLILLIKNISQMSESLASSSDELSSNSQQLSLASGEIAKTIEEIARGATNQAKENEQGVERTSELGSYIEDTRIIRNNLNNALENVDLLKNEGVYVLEHLVEKSIENSEASKRINSVVFETNESTKKIENAGEMLKSIAAQTNMLALNASIEAARAGESGKGFAVVADEIRSLAEQSGKFTNEILKIIQELSDKSKNAVVSIEQATEIVKSQNEIVDDTSKKFEGISNAIETMKRELKELNESSEMMERKKEDMMDMISNLSAISEENAAGTQEASASVEEQTASIMEIAESTDFLAELAQKMMMEIEKFKY